MADSALATASGLISDGLTMNIWDFDRLSMHHPFLALKQNKKMWCITNSMYAQTLLHDVYPYDMLLVRLAHVDFRTTSLILEAGSAESWPAYQSLQNHVLLSTNLSVLQAAVERLGS